jgi:hypothetical protein
LGILGSLGILGIENRKPNIFFLSFPAGNYQKKKFFSFFLSVRADAANPHRASKGVREEGQGGADAHLCPRGRVVAAAQACLIPRRHERFIPK